MDSARRLESFTHKYAKYHYIYDQVPIKVFEKRPEKKKPDKRRGPIDCTSLLRDQWEDFIETLLILNTNTHNQPFSHTITPLKQWYPT